MKALNTKFQIIIWCLIVTSFTMCTPIDHYYSDYLDNSEKAYPGKVDSIVFKPGKERAAIRSLISTDTRVTKMEISWGQNGYFEADITPDDIADYKEVLIPEIEEGSYTFDIRTLDEDGNYSVRSEIFGRVYGDSYESNLNNRIIDNVQNQENNLLVNWVPESIDSTLVGTIISYKNTQGETKEIFTGSLNQTVLPEFEEESNFTFQTVFKPRSIAIDTFYAPVKTIDPAEYLISDPKLYPKGNWSVADFSSEEPNNNRIADRLIDDDLNTYWITRYSNNSTNYPDHFITIDMGEILEVDGFALAQKRGDRKIREFELHVSVDGETWEDLGLFGLEDAEEYQYIDIDEQQSIRYFKIVPTAGHDAQLQPGLAEVGAYYY